RRHTHAMRVFATADIGDQALDKLRDLGYEVRVYPDTEPPPKSALIQVLKDGVDALITTLRDKIDRDVLEAATPRLKIIAQIAAGFDNIDRQSANLLRIPFSNTPDVLTEATAEFALFILGAVSRKLYSSEKLVETGEWGSWHPHHPLLGDEVTGKTVAVIGAGRIGKAFARKCIGLDVDLLMVAHRNPDRTFLNFAAREMELRFEAGFSRSMHSIAYVSFEEALSRADYVSLHVPLISTSAGPDSTFHLMNEAAFKKMKRTAYLINTSRGAVVDEQALYGALASGEIAGAALDVFEVESLPADSPLRDPKLKDRLRMFHHFGSGTRETRLSPDPEEGMAGRAVQAGVGMLGGGLEGGPKKKPYGVKKKAF